MYTTSFLQDTDNLDEAEGEHKDGTWQPPRSIGKIVACPYMCAQLEVHAPQAIAMKVN